MYFYFYSKYSLLNEELKNLIVIKSLSKSLGFAGLRVGFCYSSKEIIKQIQTLRMSQITTSLATLVVPKIINCIFQNIPKLPFLFGLILDKFLHPCKVCTRFWKDSKIWTYHNTSCTQRFDCRYTSCFWIDIWICKYMCLL